MDMDNCYNLSALNHPTKRSDKAFPSQRRGDDLTELFRCLKGLKLEGVKTIVLEDLRYIKHGKRGTFSRQVNRLLSFWSLTRAVNWMRCCCEEKGVRIKFVSPYKTSQRCHRCGKIDSRNRKGERFRCLSCGHEDDADPERGAESGILGVGGSL